MPVAVTTSDAVRFVSPFNGRDLTGWLATPRTNGLMWPHGPTVAEAAPGVLSDDHETLAFEHPAARTVEVGAIVGRQDAPGDGWADYLESDHTYDAFELIVIVRAKPDLPADTGIYPKSGRNASIAQNGDRRPTPRVRESTVDDHPMHPSAGSSACSSKHSSADSPESTTQNDGLAPRSMVLARCARSMVRVRAGARCAIAGAPNGRLIQREAPATKVATM
jgi:hypothetical protein